MKVPLLFCSALALTALPSCRVTGKNEVPALPSLPEAWQAEPGSASMGSTGPWWEGLGDEQLSTLIEEALEHNRDLGAARARLDAASAQARIAGADLAPIVSLGGNVGKAKTVFVGLPIPGQGNVLTNRVTNYGVQLDVSWEADLWGRLRAAKGAAAADFLESAATLEGARQSVAAQTAKAWFALRTSRRQELFATATAASLERSLEIARDRYLDGRGTSIALHRAEAARAQGASALATRRADVERASRALETLLGRYPDGTVLGDAESQELLRSALPDVGPLPDVGVPAQLLERRPDLVAARARLLATDKRLDAARAALLPRLTLTGSTGRSATKAPDLTDPALTAWSIAGGLLQPIFQGGKLRAGVDLAGARLREAADSYAQSLLLACGEVESLLAIESSLEREIAFLHEAAQANRGVSILSEERYIAGRIDLAERLAEERTALASSSALADARLAHWNARVDLFLALGGGFE